jgi:hypothetical protein
MNVVEHVFLWMEDDLLGLCPGVVQLGLQIDFQSDYTSLHSHHILSSMCCHLSL